MNKADSLIRGVGVVIDDHVFDLISQNAADRCADSFEGKGVLKKDIVAVKSKNRKTYADDIIRIVNALESAGIPLIKYDRVPSDPEALMGNISGVSFVLIDWAFQKIEIGDGGIPEVKSRGVEEDDQRFVIEFIKRILELCVVPIFVFCNDPEDAKQKLAKTLGKDAVAKLLIMGKSAVASKVVKTINEWYLSSPSTYVLKAWDNIYHDARRRMFCDFSNRSSYWPVPLYKAYEKDGDNPSSALTELLIRNLRGRMANMSLIRNRLRSGSESPSREVLRNVLELSVMIPDASLPEASLGCGDLFKKSGKYLLVISCDCDCINHSKAPSSCSLRLAGKQDNEDGKVAILDGIAIPDDKSSVMVLKGTRVSNTKLETVNKIFSPKYGLALPRDRAYLFPADGGRCLCFTFGGLSLKSHQQILQDGFKRIGRVCAPYITDIRQRNAQWLQREGFPKIPKEAVRG